MCLGNRKQTEQPVQTFADKAERMQYRIRISNHHFKDTKKDTCNMKQV